MGETNSLFNYDEDNLGRRSASRNSRILDEDTMSTASDRERKPVKVDQKHSTDEDDSAYEEMEEDD